MMTAEFRLLGDIEARVDGRLVDLGPLRQRSVLAVLLVDANRLVSADHLIERVWAGRPPRSARDTLYSYLHRLRRALAPVAGAEIVRRSGGYLITVDEALIDTHRFRELVRQARAADGSAAIALFDEALALWRGDPFSGVDSPWLNGVRDILEKERFTAELDLTDLRLEQGQHAELVPELLTRTGEHQWDERLAAQLMLALYRSGRQADALAHYERTRVRLAEEFGIDPGADLRRLHQRILTSDPSLATPGPQAGPTVGDRHVPDAPLDRAVRELATAVTRQWTAEAEIRSLHRPAPLRVRWSSTGRPVTAVNDVLRGDISELAAQFRELPVRRLVVLGAPGSGKTVLTILLTLALLADRTPGDPTPVLFPLSSWNPCQEHLHHWLVRRLREDHPGLRNASAYGPDAAANLVTDERVIPVLDGLDELPPGMHAAAIDALDQAIAGNRPLVVSCRAEEYETAVRHGAILAGAAVVEIEPVRLDDAIRFLTARQHAGDTRWQPVVDHLRRRGDSPLAQALSTPLMVDLARAAYRDPASDPAELSDRRRFPDRAAVEDHLLDAFLPASYAGRPRPPGTAVRGYRPDQARRWLTFLAHHLRRTQTAEIAWWLLVRSVPRPARGVLLGLPSAGLFSLAGQLANGPLMATVYGLATAVGGCAAQGWGTRAGPLRVEVRFHGTVWPFLGRFAIGLAISVAIGLVWSLPLGAVAVLGAVFGFSLGVHVWVKVPTDVAQASSPAATHAQDRVATLTLAVSMAVAIGLFYAFAIALSAPHSNLGAVRDPFHLVRALPAGAVSALFGWFAFRHIGCLGYGLAGFVVGGVAMSHHISLGLGLAAGSVFGLAVGVTMTLSRSWGAYLCCRIWLALLGHTPPRLNRFLADAHRRGVLRQAGAVYHFRHARLRDRLTEGR